MQTVNIYTHSTIRGPGKRDGVGVYVLQLDGCGDQGTRKHITALRDMSQQAAELELLRMATERLRTAVTLRIYTENVAIAAAMMNGWVKRWELDEWSTSKGEIVANAEAWKSILAMIRGVGIAEDSIEWHIKEKHEFSELMRWEASNKLAEMRGKHEQETG